MNKKRLITSALPYVNNIPHLGNLIQVLSADVFARYCRSNGYDTLYVCGTDEYGTATETKALSEGVTPKELCDKYYKVHRDIYDWFNIDFDKFGRTSSPEQTEIVQEIFLRLDADGYVFEKEISQLYSEKSNMFLADRYVSGTCPKCAYDSARGDQCESCGTLLDPLELINPVSSMDNSIPVVRKTKHLYLDLPKLLPKLEKWVSHAKEKNTWSKNAIKMTEAWMRDGLTERAITRDLKWGISVPYKGFESKVFYVWFDAPIGYISITATHTGDWKQWWKNPSEVDLYQFVGKDNIPFHTVVFPASLLGSQEESEPWTMLHRISSSEYLNYEDGMFSKSKGIGVFGNDVQDTGIPADAWRFYMMYNRPESSDYLFTWKDFQEAVNGELINNLSNLYNRTLTFICKNYDNKVLNVDLQDKAAADIWKQVAQYEEEITALLEKVELRQAYLKIFAFSSFANKLMQDYEPWKLTKENPEKAHWVLSNLAYIIKELAVLVEPYTPTLAEFMAKNLQCVLPKWRELFLYHADRKVLDSLDAIHSPELLFKRLENDVIQEFKLRFSGSQESRKMQTEQKEQGMENDKTSEHTGSDGVKGAEEINVAEKFAQDVCLKVAKIKEVSPHPDADKLYILSLDDGSEEGRTIVSGIKDYYTIEALTGKHIIVLANLKPANLRGVRSNGMLLAASVANSDGKKEEVDVVFANDAGVGSIIHPKGTKLPTEYSTLKVDKFFGYAIRSNALRALELVVDAASSDTKQCPLVYTHDGEDTAVFAPRLANASVG